MRSLVKAIAALLFICFPALLTHAESSSGEARLTSARVVEITPGKIVTASIVVTNRSEAAAVYEEAFALPATWQRVSPAAAPMVLAPGAQQLRLVAFAVPANSPAGTFDLIYVLTNARTRAAVATTALKVVVLPVVKLELMREDQIDTAIAGEMYEARLRVVNRGNSALKVAISAVTAPTTPVRFEPAELTLDAASSQLVRAFVASDVELETPLAQVLTAKATAVGTDGATASATQTIVVNVIPRITGDRDPHVRLPAQLRFITVAENGRVAGQAEFSGAGHLDENRTRRLEFLFRGPSLESKSLYGLTSEYRISYSTPKLDLQLGDHNYTLSPLTQRFNYGRGVGVHYRPGATSAGAFYMRTLERVRDFETIGSYIRHAFTPNVSVQANALHKGDSGLAHERGATTLFSLQPHFDFGQRLQLDLEYGMSTAASGTAAHAHRIEAQGQLFDDTTYAVERVHAGDKFFGYYHGTDTTQAAVTFPIYAALRGKVSFNQDERDSATDSPRERPLPPGVFTTRQTAHRPGLTLRVSASTDVSLEYQNIERNATLQTGHHESVEHSARLGVGHSRGNFSLQTFAELGRAEKIGPANLNTSGHEAVHRYSAFLHYRPSTRQSYSIFGSVGSSATFELTERTQSFGASAQWNFSNRFSAALNLARNEYDSRTARVQDTATGSINYTLPNRHVVGMQGRWIKNSLTRETGTSMMVSYTIPFSMRGFKKTSGGAIRGRIFQLDGDRPRPMSRVVVTANGVTAVTDRSGEFVFPSLAPGRYHLNVEQRSLGADHVTTEPVPMLIEVNKGTRAEFSVGVVRSARVNVKVALYTPAPRVLRKDSFAPAEAHLPAGGLHAALVELSDGRQVLRQTTGHDGEVLFDQLRPGKWTLRVYQNNIPENHAIETPEAEFELQPGQAHETIVRVLPKIRPIRFIDGGTIPAK